MLVLGGVGGVREREREVHTNQVNIKQARNTARLMAFKVNVFGVKPNFLEEL